MFESVILLVDGAAVCQVTFTMKHIPSPKLKRQKSDVSGFLSKE